MFSNLCIDFTHCCTTDCIFLFLLLNMISLLLSSADTFHEVKKKRDRKKEVQFLFRLMGEKKNKKRKI